MGLEVEVQADGPPTTFPPTLAIPSLGAGRGGLGEGGPLPGVGG